LAGFTSLRHSDRHTRDTGASISPTEMTSQVGALPEAGSFDTH
jgi:hypothetical protein